jgi:alpha-glucosidase (family GH31 glycosyl hydrolase)
MPNLEIPYLENEYWWGGAVDFGVAMPFGPGRPPADIDLGDTRLGGTPWGNQLTPCYVSSKGRYVWSDAPFRARFGEKALALEGPAPFVQGRGDEPTLASAALAAGRAHFPPSGKIPHEVLFTKPQFTTWIEFIYEQNQVGILDYARKAAAAGYGPGALIIDAGWYEDYGDWRFHPGRFPDPAAMVRELHALGFKVVMWLVPFVSPDSLTFRKLRAAGALVRNADGTVAIREWWDGYSAVVDITGGPGLAWMQAECDRLRRDFGVDGFKFDAGDPSALQPGDLYADPAVRYPADFAEAWARFGEQYPLNEYRACWKMGGRPLAQRLRDKLHDWDNNGLRNLVPNVLAQGLVGLPFGCPDLIGGGEYMNFTANSDKLDHELFVRAAQCAALMPMMQFSAAPWRVLSPRHAAACVAAAKLHEEHADLILRLAREAAATGVPIIRPLAWEFPAAGLEQVNDCFMLGSELLVAPVQAKGATSRSVPLPPGKWRDDEGVVHEGGRAIEIAAPLERLPRFQRLRD